MKYTLKSITWLFIILGYQGAVAQLTTAPDAVRTDNKGTNQVGEPISLAPLKLSELTAGDTYNVFTTCDEEQYYVGYQLVYDLGDQSTEVLWQQAVAIALLENGSEVMSGELSLSMESQTFVSTIFYDQVVACGGADSYTFSIDLLNSTDAPLDHIYVIQKLYPLNVHTLDPYASFEVGFANGAHSNAFNIFWDTNTEGAEEFELQWVFIDAYDEVIPQTAQEAFGLKEGSGVIVAGGSYPLNAYYPEGDLWFRVRAIGVNPDHPDYSPVGNWQYANGKALIENHSDIISWQVVNTYAEEGKAKQVMQYLDGSMRQRQVLTNLSTDDNVIIGESLYDFEGRPSVTILPVPVNAQDLNYRPDFNVFDVPSGWTDATKYLYDNDAFTNATLSVSTGASRYYSSSNDLYTSGDCPECDMVPDAEGYAYTQTTFLNDNTGRTVKQSGVGATFNIDDGRVTQMFYADASQTELVRLFGSNVGDASHYQKNAVMDPNGQLSVSYIDQEGRTIATSLAGAAPRNVEELSSLSDENWEDVTIDISNKKQIDGRTVKHVHSIFNEDTNTGFAFEYDLNAWASDVVDFGCVNCRYDLEITITDPDGHLVAINVDVSRSIPNQSADDYSFKILDFNVSDCDSPEALGKVAFDAIFPEVGTYTFVKRLYAYEVSWDDLEQIVLQDASVIEEIELIEETYVLDETLCEYCTDCDVEAEIEEAISEVVAQDCGNILNQVIEELKSDYYAENPDAGAYDPPQEDIESHELYCEYEFCHKNEQSAAFELQASRIVDWDEAMALGYDHMIELDPFFNDASQSGSDAYAQMEDLINNVVVAEINGHVFSGTLIEVLAYNDEDYYIDEDGNVGQGYHILYWELQASGAPESEFRTQKWRLYKAYYEEFKRQVKLGLDEVQNCPSLKSKLEIVDTMPTEEEDIEDLLDEWGLVGEVSEDQVSNFMVSLDIECGATFSETDSAAIAEGLKAYFDLDLTNTLEYIDVDDLDEEPLKSVNDILDYYDCGLDGFAIDDPFYCLRDTVISFEDEQSVLAASLLAMSTGEEIVNTDDSALVTAATTTITDCASVPDMPVDQLAALQQFYDITDGPNWKDITPGREWDADGDGMLDEENQDNWEGITKDCTSGEVVSITLSYKGLSTLNSDLKLDDWDVSSLNSLRHLYLVSGEVEGDITQWDITELSKLEIVYLDYNKISGDISEFDISNNINLKELNLRSNQLSGNLTNFDISNNTVLEMILLDWNQSITGNLPDWDISNNVNLESIYLTLCDLTGDITEWDISANTNLSHLDLDYCNLSGDITQWDLSHLNELLFLELGGNDLSGDITQMEIPSSVVRLRMFDNYNITGDITQWEDLLNFSDLYELSLDNNYISGDISSLDLSSLERLTELYLSNNELRGELDQWNNYPNGLEELSLSDNQITGDLSQWDISGMEKLVRLYLDDNFLVGNLQQSEFPATLSYLLIRGNYFTFSDLIWSVQNYDIQNYYYSPQRNVDQVRYYDAFLGGQFMLEAMVDRNLSPASKYQWYKDGIPITEIGEDKFILTIDDLQESDYGTYHYIIENDGASDLTLQSEPIYIQPVEGYTICLEYGISDDFYFEVDLEEEVQACLDRQQEELNYLIEYATQKVIDAKLSEIYSEFSTGCVNNVDEKITYTYAPKEYHYTLYYYNQAGDLVQTVPPNGVNPLTSAETEAFILNGGGTEPAHELKTRYQYNSLGQLIWQDTPDGGTSQFLYDSKGQLRLSQDAEQTKTNKYSYSQYDALGRIIEVGAYTDSREISDITQAELDDADFPGADNYEMTDVTRTYYDQPAEAIQDVFAQKNLRSRVSYSEVLDTENAEPVATYYSYDAHGNVHALLQDIPGLGQKRIDYDYDLISGNVNHVIYQYGEEDQFYHRYTYDADNRIQQVETSHDGYIWTVDAVYYYYPHGPLARVELGDYKVQGLDYYYSLQGWLKGINMPGGGADPGADGVTSGKDEMAFILGYHENDYQPIGGMALPGSQDQLWARYDEQHGTTGLYNGNIAWMGTDIPEVGRKNAGDGAKGYQAMLYNYDQLNRIVAANSLTDHNPTTGFGSRTQASEAYDAGYTYDPNGNLLSLNRHNENGDIQDEFTYLYEAGTNRLLSHTDDYDDTGIPDSKVYNSSPLQHDGEAYKNITLDSGTDLPSGNTAEMTVTERFTMKPGAKISSGAAFGLYFDPDVSYGVSQYEYDAIGNLVRDNDQKTTIAWTTYGKVRSVTKDNGDVTTFQYDAAGNRIEKQVTQEGVTTTTHYTRDASGNIMATYKQEDGTTPEVTEQPIYGSSRLGNYLSEIPEGKLQLGHKHYELSNHLGNVLAVVSDNINMAGGEATASVVSTSDYYPFGLQMTDRTIASEEYRYGFNGKEKDDNGEFGSNTVYDYGFRIYNPAIARFLSVDPLTKSYPWYTPYQFAGNKPISSIDVDGLEPYDVNGNRIDQLEESNLSSIDPKTDNSIWNDLRSHSNEQGSTRGGGRFQSASGERVDVQGIDQAIGGARNVDYYSLSIDQLPTGFSKEDLFEGFRVYLNHFVGAGTDFKEFSVEDQKLWLSSNPIGAVMQFDGSPIPVENNIIEDWLSDDLTVVVTSHKVANTHSQWVFSTATTLKNGGHAVSGSRQFGISENINGGFTFWTRGTDRAHNLFDAIISPIVFKSGEKIWQQLFQNVNSFINENGGRSSVVKPISTRVND